MTARYVAVIGMFTTAAAAVVGCAAVWGPGGQLTVLMLAAVVFMTTSIAAVNLDRPPAPPSASKPKTPEA